MGMPIPRAITARRCGLLLLLLTKTEERSADAGAVISTQHKIAPQSSRSHPHIAVPIPTSPYLHAVCRLPAKASFPGQRKCTQYRTVASARSNDNELPARACAVRHGHRVATCAEVELPQHAAVARVQRVQHGAAARHE